MHRHLELISQLYLVDISRLLWFSSFPLNNRDTILSKKLSALGEFLYIQIKGLAKPLEQAQRAEKEYLLAVDWNCCLDQFRRWYRSQFQRLGPCH
jgi:hypothetical protein